MLNVEQYEYIGSNLNAGIKVLLHDQDEMPQMDNQGFSVAPGMRSLVAIKKTTVSILSSHDGDGI